VWLVGGGSGHAFKHGPVLGEYVSAKIIKGGEADSLFRLAAKQRVKRRMIY
jgi:glycine/D-amino acid oxidase-like deaminating enzyme